MKSNKLSLQVRLAVLTVSAAMVSACATGGANSKLARLSSPTIDKPTVAVLPFEAAGYKSLQQNDRMVRDFERSYFPARLVRSLGASTGISAAYFSPGFTPAADYNVKGTIKKSDGKMTVLNIAVNAADGTPVWSQNFSVNTTSAEFKSQADPSGRVWPQIATAVAGSKQVAGQFAVARTVGYSEQKQTPVTDKRARVSNEGAAAERHGVLEPATKNLVARAAAADSIYITWQRESTPLVEQRSGEKTAEAMSIVTSVLGGVAAGMGAYAGNTQLTTAGTNIVTEASNNYEVSQKKIAEINKTLATASQLLVWHKGQPTSVHVFGKVYTFTGSLENQQAELRKVVATELSKVTD